MDEHRGELFRQEIHVWGGDNLRQFPWREEDANFYEVFIAEFFLTQTPAENVARVYPEFLVRYPSLEAIRHSNVGSLAESIEPLWFHNMRSEALHSISLNYDKIPTDPDELRTLPRVGDYVANATACFALESPTTVLDRNVKRIYSRVFADEWLEQRTEQEKFASRLLPESEARMYNLALIDSGAKVCTPSPHCSECFENDYCTYYQEQKTTSEGSG